MILNYKIIDFF